MGTSIGRDPIPKRDAIQVSIVMSERQEHKAHKSQHSVARHSNISMSSGLKKKKIIKIETLQKV